MPRDTYTDGTIRYWDQNGQECVMRPVLVPIKIPAVLAWGDNGTTGQILDLSSCVTIYVEAYRIEYREIGASHAP